MLRRNISAARYASYRGCTNSDRDAARLYRWNLEAAAALHESLAIVEVVMRNAMDRELRTWNAARGTGNDEWVQFPENPLKALLTNPKNPAQTTFRTAHHRASLSLRARQPQHPRHGLPVDHDDLVAHITFGTWVKLLPHRDATQRSGLGGNRQRGLWLNALHRAFPNAPSGPTVHHWAVRLLDIRNRVAHAEPLFTCDLMSYHRTATRLVRAIDEPAGQWHSGVSRVPRLVAERPC